MIDEYVPDAMEKLGAGSPQEEQFASHVFEALDIANRCCSSMVWVNWVCSAV